MRDDELTTAWAALEARRRVTRAPETPSAEDLVSALDGTLPTEERERVLDETFAHGRGDDLRLLHALREAAASSVPAARGVAGGGARRWWPMAAAAMLVVAVGIPTMRARRSGAIASSEAAMYRSGETDDVELVSPASGVSWPAASTDSLRVTWRAVATAVDYRVELLDAAGKVVAARVVTGDTTTRIGVPANVPVIVPSGWWVQATLSNGRRVRSELRLLEPHRP